LFSVVGLVGDSSRLTTQRIDRLLQAKVEIVVTEGELGETVLATVNQLGATTLVVGLHDKSFLYR
jgi:hypothetical protein